MLADPGLSWYAGPEAKGGDRLPKFTYKAGIAVEYSIDKNEKYAISTGLLFADFQTFISSSLGNSTISIDFRQMYLQVPITLRATVYQYNYFRFYIQGGVLGSRRLNVESYYEIAPPPAGIPEIRPVTTRPFQLSALAGIGAEFTVGQYLGLLMGVQYNHGLVAVFRDDKEKRHVLQLSTGLLF